jgi:hypothetical protein
MMRKEHSRHVVAQIQAEVRGDEREPARVERRDGSERERVHPPHPPARKAALLIAEEIRSTKITGVPPVVGAVSPATTATARTNTVTTAATTGRREEGASTALATKAHAGVFSVSSVVIAALSAELWR